MKRFLYGVMFGVILMGALSTLFFWEYKPPSQCLLSKPCTHLTEMQAVSKYLSYCIYVDSMFVCKKKDVERFKDSLVKYSVKPQ